MAPDYRVTYVGHATTLIEMGGSRLLTDPVLRQRVYHLRRRSAPIAEHLLDRLDAVLISHLHHDHLDLPSLRRLKFCRRASVRAFRRSPRVTSLRRVLRRS